MIKKRSRPNQRIRELSIDRDGDAPEDSATLDGTPPIEDLIEYRKLKQRREGIDVAKLQAGERRRRKKEDEGVMEQGGLRPGAKPAIAEEETKDEKLKRTVRQQNFTQQTNTLDVDKHMLQYIEENMKARRQTSEKPDETSKPNTSDTTKDGEADVADKYKIQQKVVNEEGSVTNSLTMLTAIPEVDLGMDTRLRNIEETEKAKRAAAEERKTRTRNTNHDEDHLVATRFYKPNLRQKSDADIMRDAKLEAMGLRPDDHDTPPRQHDRPQAATDELVMERFRKRMRK